MRGAITLSLRAFLILTIVPCVVAPRVWGQEKPPVYGPILNPPKAPKDRPLSTPILPPAPVQIKPGVAKLQYAKSFNAKDFADEAASLLTKFDKSRHRFLRFVALQDGMPAEHGHDIVSYLNNAVLSSSTNVIAAKQLSKRVVVIEGDLLNPEEKDLIEFLEQYEKLADNDTFFAPTFQLPLIEQLVIGASIKVELVDKTQIDATFQGITKEGNVQFIRVSNGKSGKVEVCGRKFATPVQENDVVAAAHLGDSGVILAAATHSRVPIMELTEWVNGVFNSDVGTGGKYYDLVGVRKSNDPNVTDFELWLKDAGASIEIVEELKAKSKALTMRSNVTEKTRITVMFYALATRPEVGPTVVFLTFDPSKNNFNDDKNPLENVINFDSRKERKFAGIEAIVFRPNGFLQYAAFNSKLERVFTVPEDIARDKQAPEHAGSNVIFAGLSCARCHDKDEDNNGFRSIVNDALSQRKAPQGEGIIADLSVPSKHTEDLDRFLSEFGAEPDRILLQSRVMFASAVSRSTGKGPFEMIKPLSQAYEEYADGQVTPERAALDLGYVVKEGEGAAFLRELLPLVETPDGIVIAGNAIRGFRENSGVQWLKIGVPIHATQWRLYRRQAMLRAVFQEEEWKKEKEKQKEQAGDK